MADVVRKAALRSFNGSLSEVEESEVALGGLCMQNSV